MWKIKQVKRDAGKAVWGNYLWCMIVALILVMATHLGDFAKALTERDALRRGNLYVFVTENMKQKNLFFDIYLIRSKYRFKEISIQEGFTYEPSELGRKLMDAFEKRLGKSAEITYFSMDSDDKLYNDFLNSIYYSAKSEMKGFPRTIGWGPMPRTNKLFSDVPIAGMFMVLLGLLVLTILYLLGNWFFLETAKGNKPDLFTIKDAVADDYSAMGIYVLTQIKIFLWSILLVIPGIIKALEYCLVPYLLKDHPGMDAKEAWAKSRELMRGHKRRALLLSLSYLPWLLLLIPTTVAVYWFFGKFQAALLSALLETIFIYPFMETAYARLYLELTKDEEK